MTFIRKNFIVVQREMGARAVEKGYVTQVINNLTRE